MPDIEVDVDFAPGLKRVGTLHRHARRGAEAVSFEYHPSWLEGSRRAGRSALPNRTSVHPLSHKAAAKHVVAVHGFEGIKRLLMSGPLVMVGTRPVTAPA